MSARCSPRGISSKLNGTTSALGASLAQRANKGLIPQSGQPTKLYRTSKPTRLGRNQPDIRRNTNTKLVETIPAWIESSPKPDESKQMLAGDKQNQTDRGRIQWTDRRHKPDFGKATQIDVNPSLVEGHPKFAKRNSKLGETCPNIVKRNQIGRTRPNDSRTRNYYRRTQLDFGQTSLRARYASYLLQRSIARASIVLRLQQRRQACRKAAIGLLNVARSTKV